MPSNTLRNSLIAVAVIGGAAWWLGAFDGGEAKKNALPPAQVTPATATRRDMPVEVPLVGTVVPYETVSIKSRLDSQVTSVKFHDGDNVTEGQVLFELDDRAVKAQIKQYEAAVEKEKAQLVNTRLQYDRSRKLVETNAVSQAQVDETRAAYEAQLAQVGAAQANLDNARVQLTYTTIAAPISGRTGTIGVTRGNTVKANDLTLVTINQIHPIRVQFAIPQRYYDKVRAAMAGSDGLSVKASDTRKQPLAEGKLQYLENTIDASSGTFAARAAFANDDEKLWPGMFVNIALELGIEKNALVVPAVAVQGDENNRFVFTIKDNKSVRTPVEVMDNNGTTAIVTKGVEEGDQVIVDGLLRVTDGGAVKIVEKDSTDHHPTGDETTINSAH